MACIDHDIDQLMILFMDFLGIGRIFNKSVVGMDGSRHDWIAKLFNYLKRDVVIGNPDPHAFFPALEEMGDIVVCFQYICKRSGEGPPHQPENIIVDRPGIIGKLAKAVADERKIGFFAFDSLDLGNPVDRPYLGDVAT